MGKFAIISKKFQLGEQKKNTRKQKRESQLTIRLVKIIRKKIHLIKNDTNISFHYGGKMEVNHFNRKKSHKKPYKFNQQWNSKRALKTIAIS